MFRKLFGLFSLEQRVIDGVSLHLQQNSSALLQKIAVLEKDIAAKAQQIDKLRSEMQKRLGLIEYHFGAELSEREKAREESVKNLRLGK